MVGVTEHWNRILAWLTEHAPTTRAALRPGSDARLDLEVPAELVQWWSVCDGTRPHAFAEIFPPFYTPVGPHQALELRERNRSFLVETPSEAGALTSGFHREWLPIATDGLGDVLAVDLRPGVLRGCVVEWDRERREMVKPEWTGIVEMFDQVAMALETRSRLGHCQPVVNSAGELSWYTD
jgi:cell wall assembly regulator SMI1